MAVTFDATNTISSSALESVLTGPYQSLGPSDINAIFLNPNGVLFNNQHGGDSTTPVDPRLPGYAQNTHYETTASLASSSEVDTYRIASPSGSNGQGLVLTATVRAVDPNGVAPRVTILDGDQNVVSAQILANGDGVFTIQASNLKSGGNYYLQVSSGGSTAGVGNYALDAEFGSTAANLSTFASGSLSASAPQQSYNFYVAESQLFQFLLSADGVRRTGGLGRADDDQGPERQRRLRPHRRRGRHGQQQRPLADPRGLHAELHRAGSARRSRTDAGLQLDGRVDQRPDRCRDQ